MIFRKGNKPTLKDAISISIIDKITDGGDKQLQLGKHMLNEGNLDLAELAFNRAIDKTEKPKLKVRSLLGRAEVQEKRKRFNKAYQTLGAAKELISNNESSSSLTGLVYQKEGEVAFDEGDYHHALEAYQTAKDEFGKSDRTESRIEVLLQLGNSAQRILNFELAYNNYQRACELLDEQNDLSVYARLRAGEALTALGKVAESNEYYDSAEKMICEGRNKRLAKYLAEVQQKRAFNVNLIGDVEKSARGYRKSLKYEQDLRRKSIVSSRLAKIYFSAGFPRKASSFEREALTLCEIADETYPSTYFNLFQLNLSRGRIKRSEKQFYQAKLGLNRPFGKSTKVYIKSNAVRLMIVKGEVKEAKREVKKLYEEVLATGLDSYIAPLLNTFGYISLLYGEVENAESYYSEVLSRVGQGMYLLIEAQALAGLAEVDLVKSHPDQAKRHLGHAIGIARDCGSKLFEHHLLIRRAVIQNEEVSPEETLRSLKELLELGKQYQCLSLDIMAKVDIGLHSWHELKNNAEALEYLYDAVQDAEESGLKLSSVIVKGWIGSILDDRGEPEDAKKWLENALAEMEDLELDTVHKLDIAERYKNLTGWFFA